MVNDTDWSSLSNARADLRADCSRCEGLCCVAPAFFKSADFAIDKPAGRRCPELQPDLSCGIHANLRERGFSGCAVFDCFGAGQQVVQVTFPGGDWRQAPETATSMFSVFGVMRQLKQLLWYLAEAVAAMPPCPLREAVELAQTKTQAMVDSSAQNLERLDIAAYRGAGRSAAR